jgi:hypothetical protein
VVGKKAPKGWTLNTRCQAFGVQAIAWVVGKKAPKGWTLNIRSQRLEYKL